MIERLVQLIMVGFAGAIGTLARLGLTSLTELLLHDRIRAAAPGSTALVGAAGTLLVNVLGSMLFGLLWAATEPRLPASIEIRILLLTGFMGAFTTFSTFSFDTVQLLREGNAGLAVGNAAANLTLGLGGFFLGLWLGQRLA